MAYPIISFHQERHNKMRLSKERIKISKRWQESCSMRNTDINKDEEEPVEDKEK